MSKKRIFITFAVPEDTYARDFLVGQARNKQSPFEFLDMSVKEPWSEAWKTNCRTKIRGCDGAIALLSSATRNSSGARWEIECAVEEGLAVIGVRIKADETFEPPPELAGKKVINWTWDGIASFVDSL